MRVTAEWKQRGVVQNRMYDTVPPKEEVYARAPAGKVDLHTVTATDIIGNPAGA